jgi:hypothetical protein
MHSTLRQCFAVLALIFIIFGTLTNILTCGICLRKNLRCTPTFIFMAFMVIADTLALYGLNLDWYFYNAFFPEYISDKYWFYCKIHYFIHLFPLKISAWLLVSLKFVFCIHSGCMERVFYAYLPKKVQIIYGSLF